LNNLDSLNPDDDENCSNIKIINLLVWKKSNVTDRQTAFTRAVCHCILNSEHEGVKIDQAYILDKMRVFLVCIISLFNVLCVIFLYNIDASCNQLH